MRQFSNILVSRTDRIGDVVLALPVVNVLRQNFPSARITFLVSEYAKDVVDSHPAIDDVMVYSPRESLTALVRKFKEKNFDLAVVLFPVFKIALALFLARVPVRIGTGYRIFSFLFNKRIYEHRKFSLKHEVEYNLGLLRGIGIEPSAVKFELSIPETAFKKVAEVLSAYGLKFGDYIIVHPGSKGSARDLKLEKFSEIVKRLNAEGFKIVLTGSSQERELSESVAQGLDGVYNFAGLFSLKELMALINGALIFISNSTGPIHIASALGVPVIGFYPPIKVMSPRRWGPYTSDRKVFSPNVPFECEKCIGKRCKFFDCMDLIDVSEVVSAVKERLGINV